MTPLDPIQRIRTAGGIVLGERATVAMVRHRIGLGTWFFPKGHLEPGETEEEAARREVWEETGLTDLEFLDDLGTYERYHMTPDEQIVRSEIKEIHMFLFAAPPGATLAPTLEISDAKWVPITKVAEKCGSVRDCVWFASVFDRIKEAVRRD